MEKMRLRRKILLLLTLISSVIYIGWRIIYTIPTSYGWLSLLAGVALIVAETISVIEAFEHYRNMSSAVIPEKPEIPLEWFPEIDVLIATHNEPVELLYKTINGCNHMDYPDSKKVHIHLCDDMDRPEMRDLADEMGIGYFGLSENDEAKAGNLNNALEKTHAPLVVTFDADMIPTHKFLLETVPYFFLPRMEKNKDGLWVERENVDEEDKIGFIQTPQSFYNADLFQYNLHSEDRIPNEQDYFFREVNVGRNRTNSAIYAGSNTVISRQALEEVGGITVGTITEDFATGIEIQSKGYRCYAIDQALAHGLAPTTVLSLIKQRERWGRGCVQTIRRKEFIFNKDLNWRTKLSYYASFMYWWTFMRRFIYIISPILFTVFHIHVVECSLWELIIIWLPSYLLYNRTLRVISGNIRNQRWSNVVDTIIFPYLVFPIFLETIGVKLSKFAVTKKDRSTINSESNLRYAAPHMILIVFSLIGLYVSVRDAVIFHSFGNIIVIYWLCVNLYNLTMAVLFMLGRTNYRQYERFDAEVDVRIILPEETIVTRTCDISEFGLALMMDQSQLIPVDETCTLRIHNERYEAEVDAKLVHVIQVENQVKYCFEIVSCTPADKRKYYQIVYDRGHSYPNYLSPSVTVLDDLRVNLQGRAFVPMQSNRKRPRILLNQSILTSDGEKAILRDFNYKYALVEIEGGHRDKLSLELESGQFMELIYDERISVFKGPNEGVYHVENAEVLVSSQRFQKLMESWIQEKQKINHDLSELHEATDLDG
ncbi:glycosyltransferase [Gottschalkiaceae bacterium SANA]|nr:glycosyltransferase [Gottschalkiaceae bacterium SANA]